MTAAVPVSSDLEPFSQNGPRSSAYVTSFQVPPFWTDFSLLPGASDLQTSLPFQEQDYSWAPSAFQGHSFETTSQQVAQWEADASLLPAKMPAIENKTGLLPATGHKHTQSLPSLGISFGSEMVTRSMANFDLSLINDWLQGDMSAAPSRPGGQPCAVQSQRSSIAASANTKGPCPSHSDDLPSWLFSWGCAPPTNTPASTMAGTPDTHHTCPSPSTLSHSRERITPARSASMPGSGSITRSSGANISFKRSRVFRETTEIVIPSRSGKQDQHVYYPRKQRKAEEQHCRDDILGLRPGALPHSLPPAHDFLHPDPTKQPRQQPEKRKSDEDLYTPFWVRGEGVDREGWCSLCEPGSWKQLKQSQYWYHLRNIHGIDPATGLIYDPPHKLRIYNDTAASVEGLCGSCGQWQPICTARSKRSFANWFHHARKCHAAKVICSSQPHLIAESFETQGADTATAAYCSGDSGRAESKRARYD